MRYVPAIKGAWTYVWIIKKMRKKTFNNTEARQQKMRSDGNYIPSGRKVLTEGFKEAAAGGPE